MKNLDEFKLLPSRLGRKLSLFVTTLMLSHSYAQNASEYLNNAPINGTDNSGFGARALFSVPTTGGGIRNTATGYYSLFSNTTGNYNTGLGAQALFSNTDGENNTACGVDALYSNTSGGYNTAIGSLPLYFNTTGAFNVGVGNSPLYSNTTGSENVAIGSGCLYSNTSGNYNFAGGQVALYSNTTGYANIALGWYAMYGNTTGNFNVAIGSDVLVSNTIGSSNICVGNAALSNNTTGSGNVAFGPGSLSSNSTGNNNTSIGSGSDVGAGNYTNATAVGAYAVVNASDKIRFGDANVTVVEGPVAYTTSDARFKTNISETDVRGLDFILKLRPVVYNFDTKKLTEFLTKNMPDSVRKHHLNKDFSGSTAIRQSGFIAQEVEKAAEETGYNFNGIHKPNDENDNYSLAYSQFVVPMIKAMQEQQKMIETLQNQINEQKKLNGELLQKLGNSTNLNQNSLDNSFMMGQNEPNPFTHETIVNYQLPEQTTSAYMAIYDLSGKQLSTFPITQMGSSSITLTSEKLVAGIYIYSIIADGKILDSKRMIVTQK